MGCTRCRPVGPQWAWKKKQNAATGWVSRGAACQPEVGPREEIRQLDGWQHVMDRWRAALTCGPTVGLQGVCGRKKNEAAGWVACGVDLCARGGPAVMSSIFER